ncbi:hypothetical protein HRbin06_01025 [archaeon HR06]|nr:hypothetical protein HRbin06_01025 [archaeon HR06]
MVLVDMKADVARSLYVIWQTVNNWVKRYVKEGLKDKPSRPRKAPIEEVKSIIETNPKDLGY